jgi:hypothetical protein
VWVRLERAGKPTKDAPNNVGSAIAQSAQVMKSAGLAADVVRSFTSERREPRQARAPDLLVVRRRARPQRIADSQCSPQAARRRRRTSAAAALTPPPAARGSAPPAVAVTGVKFAPTGKRRARNYYAGGFTLHGPARARVPDITGLRESVDSL